MTWHQRADQAGAGVGANLAQHLHAVHQRQVFVEQNHPGILKVAMGVPTAIAHVSPTTAARPITPPRFPPGKRRRTPPIPPFAARHAGHVGREGPEVAFEVVLPGEFQSLQLGEAAEGHQLARYLEGEVPLSGKKIVPNARDGEIGRTHTQVGEDVQPAVTEGPEPAVPPGWEPGRIKKMIPTIPHLGGPVLLVGLVVGTSPLIESTGALVAGKC